MASRTPKNDRRLGLRSGPSGGFFSPSSFYAKKSVPEKGKTTSEEDVSVKLNPKYKNYLCFVDEPNPTAPFHILPANKILDVKSREDLEGNFLNDSRRKRKYDVAFTSLFKFTCRVFAKCESTVTQKILQSIIESLNTSFDALMKCKVPVEEAYSTLVNTNARKVKSGVHYDSGLITSKRARLLPDTASSYSELSDSERQNLMRKTSEQHESAKDPDDRERESERESGHDSDSDESSNIPNSIVDNKDEDEEEEEEAVSYMTRNNSWKRLPSFYIKIFFRRKLSAKTTTH